MYNVHMYVDNKIYSKASMEHLPRKGDTIRIDDEKFVIVTEVVWCYDESKINGQRINLRLESERG